MDGYIKPDKNLAQNFAEKIFGVAFLGFLCLLAYNDHKITQFIMQSTHEAKKMYEAIDKSMATIADDIQSIKSHMGMIKRGGSEKVSIMGEEFTKEDIEKYNEQKGSKIMFFIAFVMASLVIFALADMYYAILCISVSLIIYPVAFKTQRTEKACIVILLLVFMFMNVFNRKEGTVIYEKEHASQLEPVGEAFTSPDKEQKQETFVETDTHKRLQHLDDLKTKKPDQFKSALTEQIVFSYVLFREVNILNYREVISIIKNILDQRVKLDQIEQLKGINTLTQSISKDSDIYVRDTQDLQQQQFFKYSQEQLRWFLFDNADANLFRRRMQEKFVQLFFDDGNNMVDYIIRNIETQEELSSIVDKYSRVLTKIRKELSLISIGNSKTRVQPKPPVKESFGFDQRQDNDFRFQKALLGSKYRMNNVTADDMKEIDEYDDDNVQTFVKEDDEVFRINKEIIQRDAMLDDEIKRERDYHDLANKSLRMRMTGGYEGINTPHPGYDN